MALIGLIVGMVNVSDKESINFLIGAIAITTASGAMSALSNLGYGLPAIAVFVSELMTMVGYFVAPAAVIVALKVIYSAARKP
jgi:NADH:ubiquinone oxidoreductase subunit 4 (subunit M)